MRCVLYLCIATTTRILICCYATLLRRALKGAGLTRIYEQALANGVLITRLKTIPDNVQPNQAPHVTLPALKICLTIGLSRKEVEKAGTIIRHAITKVMRQKR